MDKNGNKILMGLDVSTKTIGVTILLDDGSDYEAYEDIIDEIFFCVAVNIF